MACCLRDFLGSENHRPFLKDVWNYRNFITKTRNSVFFVQRGRFSLRWEGWHLPGCG